MHHRLVSDGRQNAPDLTSAFKFSWNESFPAGLVRRTNQSGTAFAAGPMQLVEDRMRYPRAVRWLPDILATPELLAFLWLAGNTMIAAFAWVLVGLFFK